MPLESKAQVRAMFAKAARGEISKEKVMEMVHATPNIKKLPERVRDKYRPR